MLGNVSRDKRLPRGIGECMCVNDMEEYYIIKMPRRFDADHLPEVLDQLSRRPSESSLCFDLSDTTFATPSLMTFVCSVSTSLRGTRKSIRCPTNSDVTQYLQRMDFFRMGGIEIPEEFQRHPADGRFVELQKVNVGESSRQNCDKLAQDLAITIAGDPDYLKTIEFLEFCIGELLNNVRQHAMENGFVCAQYYRKTDTVGLSISDAGIGILASLKGNPKYHELDSDAEALKLSLEYNVTGKPPTTLPYRQTQTQNSGNGLFFLSRLVAKSCSQLALCSGTCLLEQTHDRPPTTVDTSHFQGTFVELIIKRAKIPDYEKAMEEIRKERFGKMAAQPIRFG